MENLDFNISANREKLLTHLRANLSRVSPERRAWAEATLKQLENRHEFINKKDLQISEAGSDARKVKQYTGKRKSQGVKEFYNALNTPTDEKIQQFGAFKDQSKVEGQQVEAHHGVGQKKHGVIRANNALKSSNPWDDLANNLDEQRAAGLSGGNAKANAYNLGRTFHQGDAASKQGIHQYLDPIKINPENRLDAAKFEVDAAQAWSSEGDFARVTDKGMQSGASRSGVLEGMRRRGLVTPANEKAVTQELLNIPDAKNLTQFAEGRGIKTSSAPGPVFAGNQAYAGPVGMAGQVGRAVRKNPAGALTGAGLAISPQAVESALKGDYTQAAVQAGTGAATGAVANSALKTATAQLAQKLPTVASKLAPVARAAGPVGLAIGAADLLNSIVKGGTGRDLQETGQDATETRNRVIREEGRMSMRRRARRGTLSSRR